MPSRISLIHEKRSTYNINRNLEEYNSSSHGCLEGFKTSVEEISVAVVETVRELEVKPEDVTALLQFQDKTLMDEKLFCMDEQQKWLTEVKAILVKMLCRLLTGQQRFRILQKLSWIKQWKDLERIDSNFESSSVGKCYQQHCMLQRNHPRKQSQLMRHTSVLS